LLKVNNIKPFTLPKKFGLQNYYEKKDLEAVRHVMETLSKYLKRRKDIPEETAFNIKKFYSYFKEILKLHGSSDRLSLMRKLNKEKYFMNKPWLLEKVYKLK
jgi:hypothetical protein